MTEFPAEMNEAVVHNPRADTSASGAWALEWNVDRVFIIERHGFKDRFKIVDEVRLDEQQG